ncbi:MAG: hypothetical protein IKD30_06345 [Peptococcaceae bacterium]|nr:hypothetical protein [Peptococcaceae bacterium]
MEEQKIPSRSERHKKKKKEKPKKSGFFFSKIEEEPELEAEPVKKTAEVKVGNGISLYRRKKQSNRLNLTRECLRSQMLKNGNSRNWKQRKL